MPVSKHHSIAELGPPPVSDSPADNLRAAVELMQLCWRLRPWEVRRGVQRYRSVGSQLEPRLPRGSAAVA